MACSAGIGSEFSTDMTYRAVAYASTAVAGLTPADIDHLLVDARAHNQLAGVTGVLLYDGQQFFQYFEGSQEGVARVYERIMASTMHVNVRVLHDGHVDQLYFSQWHMGSSHAEGSVLQKLSNQQWLREAELLQEDVAEAGQGTPALRELLSFWEQVQAEG